MLILSRASLVGLFVLTAGVGACTLFTDTTPIEGLSDTNPADTTPDDTTPEDIAGDPPDEVTPPDVDGDIADVEEVRDDADGTPPPRFNLCGGQRPLRLEGRDITTVGPEGLGGPCGVCGDGVVVCNGIEHVRCAGARAPNACGGCGALPGQPGTACGACGRGLWACSGEGTLVCEGDLPRNWCGGCGGLRGRPLFLCNTPAGQQGAWTCDGSEAMTCTRGNANLCGGSGALSYGGTRAPSYERPQPGSAQPRDACSQNGRCGEGYLVCDSSTTLSCPEVSGVNACGSCDALPAPVGVPCGACPAQQTWQCSGSRLRCTGTPANLCGGCQTLDNRPGESCGQDQTFRCLGPNVVACIPDDPPRNACGGEGPLSAAPGTPCGTCGSGVVVCVSGEETTCQGDRGEVARNGCGGCDPLPNEPGTLCGTCGTGQWQCNGTDRLRCEGDAEELALDPCGNCGGEGALGDRCGPCQSLACIPELSRLDCDVPDTALAAHGCGAAPSATNACSGAGQGAAYRSSLLSPRFSECADEAKTIASRPVRDQTFRACLADGRLLTGDCERCLGDYGLCSLEQCEEVCHGSTSQPTACLNCRERHCKAAAELCTGLDL